MEKEKNMKERYNRIKNEIVLFRYMNIVLYFMMLTISVSSNILFFLFALPFIYGLVKIDEYHHSLKEKMILMKNRLINRKNGADTVRESFR
jgi:hypothetical protein